jgi:hypothetical protein
MRAGFVGSTGTSTLDGIGGVCRAEDDQNLNVRRDRRRIQAFLRERGLASLPSPIIDQEEHMLKSRTTTSISFGGAGRRA